MRGTRQFGSATFTQALAMITERATSPAWMAVARLTPATDHPTAVRMLLLSGACRGDPPQVRLWRFALERINPEHEGALRRAPGASSLKQRAGAACAALQRTNSALAGSGSGAAPAGHRVAIRERIPVRVTEATDEIVIAVEPRRSWFGALATRRRFTASAVLMEPGTGYERGTSFLAVIETGRTDCARCALSALRQALESSLLVNPEPMGRVDPMQPTGIARKILRRRSAQALLRRVARRNDAADVTRC